MTVDPDTTLAGRRVLITRAADQSISLRAALAARGAEVVACPVIRIETLVQPDDLPDLTVFHWLVLTSCNAVRALSGMLAGRPLPASIRVAVVGPGTAAAMADLGCRTDLVPDDGTGAGLAAAFGTVGPLARVRVLRLRGDRAPSDVEDALTALGAVVEPLTVYRTLTVPPPAAVAAAIEAGRIDAVTFASPSAVSGLDAGVPGHRMHDGVPAVCIGGVTARAATAAGWCRVAVASEPTVEALVLAVTRVLTTHT